jgi:hypothetical protein
MLLAMAVPSKIRAVMAALVVNRRRRCEEGKVTRDETPKRAGRRVREKLALEATE